MLSSWDTSTIPSSADCCRMCSSSREHAALGLQTSPHHSSAWIPWAPQSVHALVPLMPVDLEFVLHYK